MQLYHQAQKRNLADVEKQLRQANRPPSGARPHGLGAVVGFDIGDVYVSDELYACMTPCARQALDACLVRLLKGDYGLIDEEQQDLNFESRYFGDGKGIVARYETCIGMVRVHVLKDYTLITD